MVGAYYEITLSAFHISKDDIQLEYRDERSKSTRKVRDQRSVEANKDGAQVLLENENES